MFARRIATVVIGLTLVSTAVPGLSASAAQPAVSCSA